MNTVTLGQWTSIDPKINRYRTYRVYIAEDLWGKLCLVKAWGRIGRGCRQKFYWPASDAQLSRQLQETIFRRRRRGYKPDFAAPPGSTLPHSFVENEVIQRLWPI